MLIPPTAELRRQASFDEVNRLLKNGPAYQEPTVELVLLVTPLKSFDSVRRLFDEHFTLPPKGEPVADVEYDFIFVGRQKLGVTLRRLGEPRQPFTKDVIMPVEEMDVDNSVLYPDLVLNDQCGAGNAQLLVCGSEGAAALLRDAALGTSVTIFTRIKGRARDVHLYDLYQHVYLGHRSDTLAVSIRAIQQ